MERENTKIENQNESIIKDNLTRTEIRMEKTRENIINAALEIFAECGFVKSKVSDITDRANVGYGTFYQYFKNKQELLASLLDEVINHIGDYTYLENQRDPDVRMRFYYGIFHILNYYKNNKTIFSIIKEVESSDHNFAYSEKRIKESLYESVTLNVEQFINSGFCRKSVGPETNLAICCMIDGYARQLIKEPDERISLEKSAKALAEISYNILFSDDVVVKNI